MGIDSHISFVQGVIGEELDPTSKENLERKHKAFEKDMLEVYGDYVDRTLKEADKWFTQAAKQGNAYAQYDLGLCYFNGIVVAPDLPKARELFAKSGMDKIWASTGDKGDLIDFHQ